RACVTATPPPGLSALFPYTTLFRSGHPRLVRRLRARRQPRGGGRGASGVRRRRRGRGGAGGVSGAGGLLPPGRRRLPVSGNVFSREEGRVPPAAKVVPKSAGCGWLEDGHAGQGSRRV